MHKFGNLLIGLSVLCRTDTQCECIAKFGSHCSVCMCDMPSYQSMRRGEQHKGFCK